MQPPQNLKPLTALRFFAAAWVALFSYWHKLAGGGAPPGLIAHGYLGVDLFFRPVRLHPLPRPTCRRRRRDGSATAASSGRGWRGSIRCTWSPWPLSPSWAPLRCWPAAGWTRTCCRPDRCCRTSCWSTLGVRAGGGWNHASWSISAEWFAYLSFPAFAWLALRLARRPRLAVAAALGFLVALSAAFQKLAGFPLTQRPSSGARCASCRASPMAAPCTFCGGRVWSKVASRRAVGAWLLGAILVAGAQFGLPTPC
ncbi:MAG: hypothetical protein WDM92_12315 [Caulobacteraceae bacterium]